MSDAAQIFNEAYDLIEQGNLAAARQLLDDIRAENENNPDFWWVYAHAVEDEQAGREALNRVRQLQPDYPGIDSLAQKAGISFARPIQGLQPPPASLPDLPADDFDDDFGDFDDDFEIDVGTPSNTRRNLAIIAILAVIIVVVLILVVPGLLEGGSNPTPTPTSSLGQPITEAPPLITAATVDDTEVVPTEEITETEAATLVVDATEDLDATEEVMETEAATPVGTTSEYAALAEAVAEFEVQQDGIEEDETLLGNTLLISTCSSPGEAATQSILGIADTLKNEDLNDDIEAIGFRITNCSDDVVLRVVGISRSEFDDFATETITTQQFEGLLRPIR